MSPDVPSRQTPERQMPAADPRALASQLRAEGLTRAQIARSLGVSAWRVTELLAGELPRAPGLRVRAKDELRQRARDLRRAGRTYDEIVHELGVSKSSVSLWTRDLPKPPTRRAGSYSFKRVSAARHAQWDSVLAERERERAELKATAAAAVGTLSDRDLLLIGTALYWAEGAKDKPYDRREQLKFVNSDPDVVRVHLRWLTAMGVASDRWTFALSIHESADLDRATAYWKSVVGTAGRWRKPQLKRHKPLSRRKNVGAGYHGCLVVYVLRSRREYQLMDGTWRGIVEGWSGVV